MNKQVILITGTSRGIGKQLAEYYLDKGFLVAGCSRSETTIEHDAYNHFMLDLKAETEAVGLVRKVIEHFGSLHILINNAGIAAMNHLMLTPVKSVADVIQTNFIVPFILLREAAKEMSRKKFGRIINFSTIAVPLNIEGEAIYAASKAALESLTRTAAYELGPLGITVNAIGPTPIDTTLIRTVESNKIEALINRQAIKRKTNIHDITNVTDFFIHPASNFITGQVIYLGGIS
jgi:3-oxoacyl-[acyl-carrier protein] reductase